MHQLYALHELSCGNLPDSKTHTGNLKTKHSLGLAELKGTSDPVEP